MKLRILFFGIFSVVLVGIFRGPLNSLLEITFKSPQYSHIILIPLVSLFLIFIERKKIFADLQYSWTAGSLGVLLGIVLYVLGWNYSGRLSPNDALTLFIASFVMIWQAGVLFFFGTTAFRRGLFPWLFLFFIVPFPDFFIENFLLTIRRGSAEVSYAIFRIGGVPVFRNGFVFSLPGLDIEIARQCSGIHSSIALFIVTLIAGHFFLRSFWRKALLVGCVFPIVSISNGLRITAITLLSVYVDRRFIDSNLHHQGGVIFFGIALLLAAPLLRWLSKGEAKAASVSRIPPET